jgi:hypothetical protein
MTMKAEPAIGSDGGVPPSGSEEEKEIGHEAPPP